MVLLPQVHKQNNKGGVHYGCPYEVIFMKAYIYNGRTYLFNPGEAPEGAVEVGKTELAPAVKAVEAPKNKAVEAPKNKAKKVSKK